MSDVNEAAARLRQHLEKTVDASAFSIGLADSEIHVYLHRRILTNLVPDEWEGFSVSTIYIGKMKAAGL